MTLECLDTIVTQRLDHLADKSLGMQIEHPGFPVLLENEVACGMQQVRFIV